jgi:DNA-binding NarL/FixJ family response regulator
MKRAVVVENFQLIADIWVSLLKQLDFTEILVLNGETETFNEILDWEPEIVLMDVNLGKDLNGFDITERLTRLKPELKVCVISMHSGEMYTSLARKVGAKGYVCKNRSLSEVRQCIEKIIAGETCYIG